VPRDQPVPAAQQQQPDLSLQARFEPQRMAKQRQEASLRSNPDWMNLQQNEQYAAFREAEEAQRKIIAEQILFLGTQVTANTDQQQSSNENRQQILSPYHSPPFAQQGPISQRDGGFTQGQSTLQDTFSQGGYPKQSDPFIVQQCAIQHTFQAGGGFQQNASPTQSYPDPEQLFAPGGYQNQPQSVINSRPYFQQQLIVSNQGQQVARDVTQLQQSPGWMEHIRHASQNRLNQQQSPIQNAPNPRPLESPLKRQATRPGMPVQNQSIPSRSPHKSTLDPRLFGSTSKQQATISGMSVQNQIVQQQGPPKYMHDPKLQTSPHKHSYNAMPGMPVQSQTGQQQNPHNPAIDLRLWMRFLGQRHNNIQGMTIQNMDSGNTAGNVTSRSDSAELDGMSGTYSNRWSKSPASDNMATTNENPRQMTRSSASPVKMVTTKKNRVRIPQPLVTPDDLVTNQELGLMRRLPVSPAGRPKRRASMLSSNPTPAIQDKKQKTSAPSQKEKIPRPPMTMPAPAPQESLEFHLPGQVSDGFFHRSFVDSPPAAPSVVPPAKKPEPKLITRPVVVPAKKPEPVARRPVAPPVVASAKKTELEPVAPQPQRPLPMQVAGIMSYDQWSTYTGLGLNLTPPTPPTYHSPYQQSVPLPPGPFPPFPQERSYLPAYSYTQRHLAENPMGFPPLPLLPPRPASPQPPHPYTHPDYITKSWHPQPCGCCPGGVPSRLIREGSAFRNFDRFRLKEGERSKEDVEQVLYRALSRGGY
jgi:hypothetical protein